VDNHNIYREDIQCYTNEISHPLPTPEDFTDFTSERNALPQFIIFQPLRYYYIYLYFNIIVFHPL